MVHKEEEEDQFVSRRVALSESDVADYVQRLFRDKLSICGWRWQELVKIFSEFAVLFQTDPNGRHLRYYRR
ncbi:hypothetical protein VTO73DRAFT_7329 [Trametes versicolor]